MRVAKLGHIEVDKLEVLGWRAQRFLRLLRVSKFLSVGKYNRQRDLRLNSSLLVEDRKFCCTELFTARSLSRTTVTGAEESEIIVSINTGTMTVMPAQFDRVITDAADTLQRCARNFNEAPLGTMALAKRAGTITTQVLFPVLTDVTVVPGDAHHTARFDMVNLRRNVHKNRRANSKARSQLTLYWFSQNSIRPSPIAVMNPILARLTK